MGNITVDDTNTVLLAYDDKWFHGNWTDLSTQPPSNQSLLSSNFLDAKLVLRFSAPGTGFTYFGMKRSGGGLFRICVDCDPNQPAGPFDQIDALNATDDGHNPPVLLYSKQGLTNDIHTVVLMNTNDTRVHPTGGSQITLDKFVITTEDQAVITVTGSATSGPATASSAPPSGGSTGSTNVGLIVGVVIGALGLLTLLVGLWLCWRRKRRASITANVEAGPDTSQRLGHSYAPVSLIDPLIIRRTQHDPSAPEAPVMPPATLPAKGATPTPFPREAPPTTSSSGAATSTSSSSANLLPSTSSRSHRRRVETDAGPVPSDEDTLPPDYAQIFDSRPEARRPASVSSNVAQVAQGNTKPS